MVENRPWLTFACARRAGARPAGRGLSRLHDLRRLDARPGDDAVRAGSAPSRAVLRRELRHRAVQRARRLVERAAGRAHDVQQPDHGARHRARQNRDLDHRGVCGRLLQVPVPDDVLLDDLHHAHAAGGGEDPADLRGGRESRPAQQLCRPDHPADRVGNRDVPVPPVLPERARRARPRRRASTAPDRCGSSAISCCRCRAPRSRRCS